LSKGEYEKALNLYNEALEHSKDNKSLYLNRALAYLKLNRYSSAIKDCTTLLEYCEYFEKGYEQSKDSCFKVKFFYWHFNNIHLGISSQKFLQKREENFNRG